MQLHHFGDMRLHKNNGLLGPDACCQPVERHFSRVLAKFLGGIHRSQRVDIHNAVDAIVIILQCHIIPDGTQIVPQMLATRRPRPRKYSSFF